MILTGEKIRVWLATRPVDFRKGHDGLSAVVQTVLGHDPYSGAWIDCIADLGPEPESPSLDEFLDRLHARTGRHSMSVVRAGAAGLALMASGLLDADRALALRTLCGERPADGVGHGGLRPGRSLADAGRPVGDAGRHGPHDWRGVAVEAPAEGGIELAVKTDAMAVRTSSEQVEGLKAADADVTRLRLGLEGTWRGLKLGAGTLAPSAEIAVRHDGGDAETGFGLDLGGGLAWSDPESGLSAEFRGRGLLTHESKGFRDRGLSGSFAWNPGQGSGRGPKLTLSQTMGSSATGGADALLGQRHLGGLAANDNGGDDLANRRLELRLGYGFSAFGERFTSTPELGLGLSKSRREYSLGWRLGLAGCGTNALKLRIEGTRSEAVNDNADPEHGIGLRVSARW